MIRRELKNKIFSALGEADFSLKWQEKEGFGDYTAVVKTEENPEAVAEKILGALSDMAEKVEFKQPFFYNVFLRSDYLQNELKKILKAGKKFGRVDFGKGEKVNVEFISANPTGPLTLGNGRGGFWGDVLANVLESAGYKPVREFYVNDSGEQIAKLGHSVIGDEEAVYSGKYIEGLKKKVKEKDFKKAGEKAAALILEEMIKPSCEKMGIDFDKWFFESDLRKSGEVSKVLDFLKEKGFSYESEGALWLKTSEFGDDKDRVLIKSDGQITYFGPDIAYLQNKYKRGFKQLYIFVGADHYGYVARLKAAAEMLGQDPETLKMPVMQLVRLMEKGEEVKMSKRSGIYVTMDELIDEVGLDAARFFFLMKSLDSHFVFDMDLAKEQSQKNPVFYAQYSYARISGILRNAKTNQSAGIDFDLLSDPAEIFLIKQIARFPEIVEDSAKDLQLQRIPRYAMNLAAAFHKFYDKCRVISDDKKLSKARLSLVGAAEITIKNALFLMGVSAPAKM